MVFRIFFTVVLTFCVCANAAEINLSKPILESLPDITGIYWNFDELAGPQQLILDISGNEHNGTLYAGNGEFPSLTEGVDRSGTSGFGQAVRLKAPGMISEKEGNPRIAVNMPVENSLAFVESSFTGGVWVRFSSMLLGENQTVVLIDKGGFNTKSGAETGHFCLFLSKDKGDSWQIGFQIGDGEENKNVSIPLSGRGVLNMDEWYHVGFSFEYKPGELNVVTLWLNGEEIGSEEVDLALTSGSTSSTARRFYVGERATTFYLSSFDGAIDDVFVTEGLHTFKPLP